MSRILEERPLFKLLRERPRILFPQKDGVEKTVQDWRERYPESAVKMAMKMADRWLKAVTK